MKKTFSCLTIVLLVFSIGLWQNNAQAQCQYIQPDGVTIDPAPVLLEIVGGNLFESCSPLPNSDTPGTTHDSWIYLVQGDTTNLHVALIDQVTRETQFSSFPVEPFAFAFADRSINTANGGLGTCFVTGGLPGGGNLTYAFSPDGLNYQTIPVDTNDQYDSCAIINMCNNNFGSNTCCDDIAIVAHNVTDDTMEGYRSNNGGLDWTDEGTLVPDACGPLDGCVVPNAVHNGQGGWIILYPLQIGGGQFKTVVLDTTTGMTRTIVISTSVNPSILKESCAAEQGVNNLFTFYNTEPNEVTGITFTDDLDQVIPGLQIAPVPDFNALGEQGYFGIGCNRFPQGPSNPEGFQIGVTTPGGETYNISIEFDGTGPFIQVNPSRDPTRKTESGPVATTLINNDIRDTNFFPGGIESGNSIAYSQSFDYAQCVFTGPASIPTLSEWGLIAMSGLLGIVGFMVIRRRKVTV